MKSRCLFYAPLKPIKSDVTNRHCDGSLNVNVYHGRGRETDRSVLADSDIILSTYHTIAAEALDMNSPLYQIKWFRIVLDEG
jgi:SWI/SNF-related matrix-associated actin-dependent regulator of chromatin subfamily A3